MFTALIAQLDAGQNLTAGQIPDVVASLVNDQITPEAKAELLAALARKGETSDELAGFARELRERAVRVPLDPTTRAEEALDVCGTGGDRLGTFNISSTVAILCAAAGVTVAKHGNRAVTSQTGSADVLEELGIRIDLAPEEAAQWLRDRRFAFLLAPRYHPAARHVAAARQLCATRGQRTIFNLLGPLLNPVRPGAQLLGVPRPELCEPMARVLQSLGTRRGMVVCGRIGEACLDEVSTLGQTTVAEYYQDHGFNVSTFSAEDLPVQKATLDDLQGGSRAVNAAIVRAVLGGAERGPKRDAVLLNAAAALFVADRCGSLAEGWQVAAQTIDGGAAAAKLRELSA